MKTKGYSNTKLPLMRVLPIILSASLLAPQMAFAVDPKPRKMGNLDVSTQLTSSLGYGDNVFRGSVTETSSGFISVKPSITGVSETLDHRLTLGYEGNGVAFFDSSDDNYLSNKVSGDFIRKINAYSDFSMGAAFEDGSTVRGTDISEGDSELFEGATDFTRKDFSLGYAIGSEKVGPSLELSYEYTDLGFDNFKLINEGRDYTLNGMTARLGYQYSVATKFFIDVSKKDFDYDTAVPLLGAQLDGSEEAVMAGVNWKLSRLTSGEIRVGSIDKEFDNFLSPDSLTAWNIQLQWTPTERDTVTIEGFSRPFEQAGTGLFQNVDQAKIAWERNLSRTLSFSSGITLGSVDFDDVAREDDFDVFAFGLRYKPTRYTQWSFDYEREEKDSNFQQFNFDTNTVFVSYTVSL